MKKEDDEIDPHAYAHEYRSMLKSVITEALRENNSVIGQLFKDAVKEWLTEQFKDKKALFFQGIVAILFATFVYLVFRPK